MGFAMTDADAFMRAILADPLADAPRLVFADWLEERGDGLSEFNRLQCSGLDPGRQRQLAVEHAGEWLGPAVQIVRPGRGSFAHHVAATFRHGFPDRLAMTADNFYQIGPRVFERWPINTVRLSDCR